MCGSDSTPVAASHTSTPAARIATLIAGALALAVFAAPVKMLASHNAVRSAGFATAAAAELALEATGEFRSADVQIHGLRPPAPELVYWGIDRQAITPERIERFLRAKRSPMARYASNIVTAGLRYGVDPRVVVAIAGVESTYGTYARGYNAWGWNAGKARWSSWKVSIDRFTRALGQSYRSLRHGRFAAASRTYCPPCGKRWGVQALRIFRAI